MPTNIIVIALIAFAAGFLLLGVLLLTRVKGDTGRKVQLRMKGVRQIKDYELGESLAAAEERKKQSQQRHRDIVRKKAFSDIPVLERRFGSKPWAERLAARLREAQLPLSATSFLLVCAACGTLGALVTVVWFRQLHFSTPILFVALGAAPYMGVSLAVGRRIRKFSIQFADALDLLSSSVKSGQALNSAIQNVAEEMPDPVGDEFKIIADELSLGLDLTDSLRHLRQRVCTQDVQFFVTALLIQRETGGNLSEVLDGLQKTIRNRFRILRQVKTITAQGRMSGWVVGILPIALGIIIYMLNPEYMGLLFEPAGQKLLILAGAFQLVGVLLIRKIVNIKV